MAERVIQAIYGVLRLMADWTKRGAGGPDQKKSKMHAGCSDQDLSRTVEENGRDLSWSSRER